MQTLISNSRRRVLGATLTALLVAAASFVSAPAAFADASTDIVLVPRITKGSSGVSMRVKRTSPAATRYFASLSRAQAPKSVICPGTICPKTRTCYDVKGALGAGCISG